MIFRQADDTMHSHNRIIRGGGILLVIIYLLMAVSGSVFAEDTDSSHDPDAVPDYEQVFPDAKIQDIFISVTPESWNEMQEDMTETYGEFGSGQAGPGTPGENPGMMPGNRSSLMEPGEHLPGMSGQEDPVYVPATISYNGETWDHVGLRYKGVNSLMTAWSQGIGKISFKIDMDRYEDEFPDTKNQKFYGFKELNLQSGMSDASVIREKIVPEIFQDAQVTAPETAFYRVYLDHGDGFSYFGLYTLVESVDDTVIQTQYSNGDGNLYKPEGEGATFAAGKFNLSSFEKKSNEDEADYSDVETLYEALHAGTRTSDPETWRGNLEEIFDVDGFLTWLATNTLIKNWDTYGGNSRNYYLYNNPDTGTFSWIPWDNNYALMEGMGRPGGMAGNNTPGSWMNMPPGEGNITITGPEGMGRPGGMAGNNTPGSWMNMPPGEGNITITGPEGRPGQMDRGAGPGGMGSQVSFSMENVTDRWPLIRYLMDDPVYHEQYVETLGRVVHESFIPEKIYEQLDLYHDLIESSVTGPDGEQDGYTYLTRDSDFDQSYEEIKQLISSQYEKALAYLAEEEAHTA